MGLWVWGPDYPDPQNYLVFGPGALVGVRAGWAEGAAPEIEAVAQEAATTVDDAVRGPLFEQFQQMLNESGPFFPLFQPTAIGRLGHRPGDRVRRSIRPSCSTCGCWHPPDTTPWRWGASSRRRLLAAVLLLLGITLVAFVLTNVVPGDPAAANLGQRAIDDPEAVAAFNHRYGLDKPLPVQYFTYLGNLVQGDLGDSQQSRRPVREDLAEYAPATFELAGTAIAISMVIGVGLGTLAAFRRDRPVDWILRVVSLLGVSIPVFWLVAHRAVRA